MFVSYNLQYFFWCWTLIYCLKSHMIVNHPVFLFVSLSCYLFCSCILLIINQINVFDNAPFVILQKGYHSSPWHFVSIPSFLSNFIIWSSGFFLKFIRLRLLLSKRMRNILCLLPRITHGASMIFLLDFACQRFPPSPLMCILLLPHECIYDMHDCFPGWWGFWTRWLHIGIISSTWSFAWNRNDYCCCQNLGYENSGMVVIVSTFS